MQIKGLEALREQWISLIKVCKIAEADELYWDELFPEIEKKFLSENSLDENYDWLVLPAGLESSYYILLIKAIKPKKVYFLGTHEFKENFLDRIIQKTGLRAADYIIDTLNYDEMDVADVYEKIRKRLDLFYGKRVILDLTRGKRIMSAGAGIVGAFFSFDLVYIDEGWVDDIKRGLPGTEKLVQVKNPFEVFGDLERKESIKLFNRYNFGASLFFYKRLRERVTDPRTVETEEILSECYLHWNSFNFPAAFHRMDSLLKKAKQYNLKFNPELKSNFEVLKILSSGDVKNPEKLSDEFNLHIIIDLYVNALRKAEVGTFEDAVSRLYRVLELISQHRLRKNGVETSRPDLKKFKSEYKKATKEIYGFEKESPFEIGLKDGYILLHIMNDFIVKGDSLEDLKKMFGVIRVRDTSIIAHGLQLAGLKAFQNMDHLARKYIMRLCKESGKDFGILVKHHTFIKL
ncbi:MAG: TIGR02710 family CRISPR-associated CARF protein [archaeon]